MESFISKSGAVRSEFIRASQDLGHLIYWHKQGRDSIQVRQLKQYRWLLLNETLQSVVDKDRPQNLLLPHLQRLAAIWQTLEEPESVLELGLGGGAIRNYIRHTYPACSISSVDNNPEVVRCYKKYFGGEQNADIRCISAEQALEDETQYDWIILDLFTQSEAPLFLFNHRFYQSLRSRLRPGGMLFINFISEHESQLQQLQHLLITNFGKQPKIEKIPDYANHLLWLDA